MHFASLLSLFASFGILVVGSPTKVEVVAARAASYPTYTCTGEIQVDEITVEPHSEFLTCCKDGIGGEGGPGNPEISTGVNCTLPTGSGGITTKGQCTDPAYSSNLCCRVHIGYVEGVGDTEGGCSIANTVT